MSTEKSGTSRDYLIIRAMNEFGWKRAFAVQYIMERTYNGLSHKSAYLEAMKSPWVNAKDKPKNPPKGV
jgi:hypothetical protein